ncbi:MAG: PucR family transcriptional regulator [Haloechinothrix sp.]
MRLPRELTRGFRPHAGALARAVVTGVGRAVPEYAWPLAGPLGHIMVAAVQAVIMRGIDAILDPRAPRDDWTGLFRGIGAAEFTAGRSLDAMQAAYRVAEKITSQHVSAYLRHHGASIDHARLCAGAIAAHCRDLSSRSTQGYTAARAEAPRPAARTRNDLFRLLLAEAPADPATLAAAARAAGWDMPGTITAVALRSPAGQGLPAPGELGTTMLAGLDGGEPCLITAADEPKLANLPDVLPGWHAAIGPPVPLADARASLRIARRAFDLAHRGLLPGQAVVDCADHPTTLMLFADDWLIDRLVEQRLAPLRGLTDRQQERMLATLHEWLATRGQANEIASRLGVHPRTVRYRVSKLEELFGDQLTDPQCRFELALAARAMLLRNRPQEAKTARGC